MYCRTCGNQMNDKAMVCVKCGVGRFVGTDYCQNCGSKTYENEDVCVECRKKLGRIVDPKVLRDESVNKGGQIGGKILLIIGLIWLFIGGIEGLISIGYDPYMFIEAIMSWVVGIIFVLIALILKIKFRKQ